MNQIITTLLTQSIRQLPLYITQIGIDYSQQHWCERLRGLEDYQLAICVGGHGIFSAGTEEYEIHEQDAFLFSPHVPHCYYPTSESPWLLDWVCFRGQCFEPLCREDFCIITRIPSQKILLALRPIETILRENRLLNQLEASKSLYALLTDLTAYRYDCYGNRSHADRAALLLAYLEEHIGRDISLPEMADYLGVSVSYLCRIFKTSYGMSPQQCLIHLRMNRAKQLMMTDPTMPIKEIAAHCGYADASYFGAEFKRHTGVSPGAYRGNPHG